MNYWNVFMEQSIEDLLEGLEQEREAIWLQQQQDA